LFNVKAGSKICMYTHTRARARTHTYTHTHTQIYYHSLVWRLSFCSYTLSGYSFWMLQ